MGLRAAGSVPETGVRAVLPTRIDAQLRRRAVTGVGGDAVRSALSAGDEVDEPLSRRRTDGRSGPVYAVERPLMRTHSTEPRASQISRRLFCF